MKILQSLRECSEIFGKLLKRSKMVLKFSENLNFANFRKTLETVQKCLCVLRSKIYDSVTRVKQKTVNTS